MNEQKFMKRKAPEKEKEFTLKAPCFSCYYIYNCKYWANSLWDDWIFKYNDCPAKYYPYNCFIQYYKVLTGKDFFDGSKDS